MDLEKYTDRAKGFLQSAQTLAVSRGHQRLTPEHLLKVLLEDPEGLCANLIRAAGGDPKAALSAVDAALDKLPRVEGRIALKANAFYRELHRFEQAYVRQISPDRPPEPCPDELAAARRMFEKYAPRLADYPVAARRKTGSRRPADVPAGFAGDGAVLL